MEKILRNLQQVNNDILVCKNCPFCEHKTNYVIGDGDCSNRIMIVSDYPGYREDQEAIPFVGYSGQILREILVEESIIPHECFMTNVLKCYPLDDDGVRTEPKQYQIKICGEYLIRQIQILDPDIIFALGKFAISFLLQVKNPIINNFRNKVHQCTLYPKAALLCSYNPASIIYERKDQNRGTDFEGRFREDILQLCKIYDQIQIEKKGSRRINRNISLI